MADPVTMGLVGGAIAAPIVGGIMGMSAADKAARAQAAERARIQELLDRIQDPAFNLADLTPEEFKVIGQVAPEAIPYIQEAAPQFIQRTTQGQQGVDAQMNALQRLRALSEGAPDAQSKSLQEQAMQQAAIQNQAQQGSIIDQMARRGGGLNSGMGLAQALNAQSVANQTASQAGTQAAQAAYQQRLQALRDSANLGGQVDQADVNLARTNADVINSYNQRMAQMRQGVAQSNVANRNQAQAANLAAQQTAADQNIALRNQAKTNRNNLAQQQYQNALDRVRIAAGISKDNQSAMGQNAAQQNMATQGMTQGISSGLLSGARLRGTKQNNGLDEEYLTDS